MPTLEDFDDVAETPVAKRPGGGSELKDLPDGEYEFEVVKMESKVIHGVKPLVTIVTELVTDSPYMGMRFDITHWLTDKDGNKDEDKFNRLRKDLDTLGFDVDKWNKSNGRTFSKELKKACEAVVGVHFMGKKVTNKSIYHNLYINKRAANDGKPEKFGPDELNAFIDPFEGGVPE